MSALILDYSTDIQHYSAKAIPQVNCLLLLHLLKRTYLISEFTSNIYNVQNFIRVIAG